MKHLQDLRGSLRTYPHLSGPFQSLDEAYNGNDCYRRDQLRSGNFEAEEDKLRFPYLVLAYSCAALDVPHAEDEEDSLEGPGKPYGRRLRRMLLE